MHLHLDAMPEGRWREGGWVDWYSSRETNSSGEPELRIRRSLASGALELLYEDGTRFLLPGTFDRIFATWPSNLTIEEAFVYLLGPVLGVLLRARGNPPFHASVVATDDGAVAFAGPAGAGKSTIAAAFARAGHQVLADDLLVVRDVDGRFSAYPGSSTVRLWPKSVEALFGAPDAKPKILSNWGKRYVDLDRDGSFRQEPLRLRAIYTIGHPPRNSPELSVKPLRQRDAMLELVASTYAGHLPGEAAGRAEFDLCRRLAEQVRVARLTVGNRWDALEHLPTAVARDCQGEVAA